ncbi:MAG: IS1595 family transposase [Acidobacteria bacterium]|nr:MAG: IS1595 family transposase [Acidobacteriota bacterium]
MNGKVKQPKTLQEAIAYFADPDNALAYMVSKRWPDGVVMCPKCGRTDPVFLKNQRKWQCKSVHQNRQFSAKVSTVFEDSPIALEKWLTAVWMLSNCRNGVSSYEIARTIGVTQKSAWFMMHRIRLGLQKKASYGNVTKIGGPENEVEVDETFVGGRKKNMHKDRALRYEQKGGAQGKAIVMGMLDRTTRQMRAEVVPNAQRDTLQSEVLSNVKYGTKVYTDDAVAYDKLHWRFVHEVVNKTESYVRGRVHVNGLENFWSLLKRGLNGTYVAVEPFHLFRYVDEQVFRFNNRKDAAKNVLTDAERFDIALSQIAGKRLTYAELTGKVGETAEF